VIHALGWCFALARRRAWRWVEAIASAAKARKAAIGKVFGIVGGFIPLLWVLPARRRGLAQFEAGEVAAAATAAVWLVLCLPALAGRAVTMPRAGLSIVVAAPIANRGLLAWWMVRAAVGAGVFVGVIWALLARHCLSTAELAWRGPALVAAWAGAVLLGIGLVGSLASLQHLLPRAVRAPLGVLLVAGAVGGGTLTIRAGFIGDAGTVFAEPWGTWWLALLRGGLRWAGEALPAVAAPWASAAPWPAALTLLALGGAVAALGLVAGRALDLPGMFEASVRQAEALAQAKRRPPGVRRPGHVRPFGLGAWALAWKALAERAGRHSRVARLIEWAILLGLSGVVAWLVAGGVVPRREWVVVVAAAVAVIFASAMGGAHEAGLGTEIHHRSWLLRIPSSPPRVLLVLLAVPWLQGVVILAAVLATIFLVAPDLRPLAAVAFAAGCACCAGVRTLRAWAWLRFPPDPGPSPLESLLHFAVASLPFALAAAVMLPAVALGLRLEAAMALAGVPGALIAGCCWPLLGRAFQRLELR
jgi:hypothetical protein